MTEATLRRRLRALQAMTVSRGCTPQEAAVAAKKAREIEAKLPKPNTWQFFQDIEAEIAAARARRKQAEEAMWREFCKAHEEGVYGG